jgi:hypothetical protein
MDGTQPRETVRGTVWVDGCRLDAMVGCKGMRSDAFITNLNLCQNPTPLPKRWRTLDNLDDRRCEVALHFSGKELGTFVVWMVSIRCGVSLYGNGSDLRRVLVTCRP